MGRQHRDVPLAFKDANSALSSQRNRRAYVRLTLFPNRRFLCDGARAGASMYPRHWDPYRQVHQLTTEPRFLLVAGFGFLVAGPARALRVAVLARSSRRVWLEPSRFRRCRLRQSDRANASASFFSHLTYSFDAVLTELPGRRIGGRSG
jgi:hypothetical protein